jgi:uncharacterized protein YecE (DUF72 family)
MKIKVGCCGFPVAKEKYYKNFDVVEIQQTFILRPKSSGHTKDVVRGSPQVEVRFSG